MRKKLSAVLLVFCGLAVGLLLNGIVSQPGPAPAAAQAQKKQQQIAPEELEELNAFAGRLEKLFQHAAQEVMPAVVSIQATRVIRERLSGPFDEFFRRQLPEEFFPERERQQRGLGSGIILDQQGNILTNNHVVAGAEELKVQLSDGQVLDAEVAGTDEKTDLAVIRLEGEFDDLPTADLGDSDDLQIGQWVLAVGNPFGLAQTVSAGIVSAKGRHGITRIDYESMIQTDAAINPGNSGGPLINLRGHVVGINSAIFSRTGGYMGIGFAIPVNMATDILEDLIAGREVVRGWLGVVIRNLTPDLSESFGFEGTDGVLIDEVLDDSPADRGGLEAGDIIIRYNGRPVDDIQRLRRLVAATDPDTTAEIVVWKDGAEETLKVEIGDQAFSALATDWLGVTVRTLTPEMAERLGEAELQGVVVTEVEDGSPADDRGIQAGFVILSVNRRKVGSVSEYRETINATRPGRMALLRVLNPRTGRAGWMTVPRPTD